MASLFQIRRGEDTSSLAIGELYYNQTSQSLQLGSNTGSIITLAKLNQKNSGSFELTGDLIVSGNTTISGNLTVSNNVTLNSNLSVGKIINVGNITNLGESLTINSMNTNITGKNTMMKLHKVLNSFGLKLILVF